MSEAVRVRTPSPLVDCLFSIEDVTTLRLRSRHPGRRWTRTGSRLATVRLGRRRRDRLESSDDLFRDVEITVRRDDHARLGPRIQDERIPVFLTNLIEDLADLIHDRLDELHLPLLHLLIERTGAALIVFLLFPSRCLTLVAYRLRERRLCLLVVSDHRLERVAHLLHLRSRRL